MTYLHLLLFAAFSSPPFAVPRILDRAGVDVTQQFVRSAQETIDTQLSRPLSPDERACMWAVSGHEFVKALEWLQFRDFVTPGWRGQPAPDVGSPVFQAHAVTDGAVTEFTRLMHVHCKRAGRDAMGRVFEDLVKHLTAWIDSPDNERASYQAWLADAMARANGVGPVPPPGHVTNAKEILSLALLVAGGAMTPVAAGLPDSMVGWNVAFAP